MLWMQLARNSKEANKLKEKKDSNEAQSLMKRQNTSLVKLYYMEPLQHRKLSTQSLPHPPEYRTIPKRLQTRKDCKLRYKSLQGHERIPCRCLSPWEFLRTPAPCSLGTPGKDRPRETEMVTVRVMGSEMG
jgi:hypothetical protein